MNNKEIKSNKRKLEIHILDQHVLTWLLSETLTWLLKERKKEKEEETSRENLNWLKSLN